MTEQIDTMAVDAILVAPPEERRNILDTVLKAQETSAKHSSGPLGFDGGRTGQSLLLEALKRINLKAAAKI